jgi:hypothetical protein
LMLLDYWKDLGWIASSIQTRLPGQVVFFSSVYLDNIVLFFLLNGCPICYSTEGEDLFPDFFKDLKMLKPFL